MRSTALILHAATAPTDSLTRTACYGSCPPVDQKGGTEFRPVHGKWTVATDANGKRRLQMHWQAD